LASGNVSGFFGPLTQAAVEAFQSKTGIVSSGTPTTTGYGTVGNKTRTAINTILSLGAQTPTTNGSSTTSTTVQTTTTTSTSGTSSNYTFTRNLSLGMTGPDVLALQQFLNAHGFTIAQTGNGSPGHETSYFGASTAAAVARFQEYFASKILTPYGLSSGTGFFGAATRGMVEGMK
jgi:peptidoglycan hydrolase-like protein with peptidoglycan-binding domain